VEEKQPEVKTGRPKKREREVVQVAEALGITLSADVMSLDDMKGFPHLDEMDEKDRAILCMNACGFSQGFMARVLGMAQPSVWERLKKADPDGMFTLSAQSKKAFMTRLAESRGLEALAYITPEKLEGSSARELIGIAKDAVGISQQLNQSKHKEVSVSKLDYMIDAMNSEASEEKK
jgi:hypothetical protein